MTKLTHEERLLLEDELWKLEVVVESPEFLTRDVLKREIKRIKEIKELLK